MPGMPAMGLVSDGLAPAAGVVSPGIAPDGLASAGLVNAGLVSPGSVRAGPVPVTGGTLTPGVVSPGVVRPGVVRPGVVRPGVVGPGVVGAGGVSPGVIRRGVVSPGVVNAGDVVEPEPVSRPVGIGGMLMPNCDSPWDRADISSLGRSVTIVAWTNSRCSVAGLVFTDSDTAITAIGLATARAATALMAVESLRRRRFGTQVSSISGLRVFGRDSSITSSAATDQVMRRPLVP